MALVAGASIGDAGYEHMNEWDIFDLKNAGYVQPMTEVEAACAAWWKSLGHNPQPSSFDCFAAGYAARPQNAQQETEKAAQGPAQLRPEPPRSAGPDSRGNARSPDTGHNAQIATDDLAKRIECAMAEDARHQAGHTQRVDFDHSLRTYYPGFNLTALAKYLADRIAPIPPVKEPS